MNKLWEAECSLQSLDARTDIRRHFCVTSHSHTVTQSLDNTFTNKYTFSPAREVCGKAQFHLSRRTIMLICSCDQHVPITLTTPVYKFASSSNTR